MREYMTVQGDCWDSISKKFYGTEKLIHKLLFANPAESHVAIFSAGTKLNIPEINVDTHVKNLPPWRRT